MNEIFSPFVRLWNWVTYTGGFPGQIMFCSVLVILFLGLAMWYGNKRS